MVHALMNSEKPRPALQRRNGARRTRHYPITRGTGPVAVSVAGGVVRPRLYAVGSNPGPAFEVKPVRAEALAQSLNSLLSGELASTDEVTAFELMLAHAYSKGLTEGRSLAGVS